MISPKLHALAITAREASVRHCKLKDERDRRIREAISRITSRINQKFHTELLQLEATMRNAQSAYFEARMLEAAAGTLHSLPIGTRLVEWDHPWSSVRRPSGKIGVVILITRDTPHNLKWYQRPDPGDLAIRILKKDGSEGKRLIPLRNAELPYNWYVEGVDPNMKKVP